MQFSSPQFIIFLGIVLVVFYLLPGKIRAPWLLAASLFFYGSWSPICLIYILFTTTTCFFAARKLRSNAHRLGRFVFLITLLCNLGILFFFKYYDFTLQNINILHGLFAPDAEPLQRSFELVLPVGISFYTFQAISYLIDVKRGTIPAEHNFLYFALYMAWFPKLVSGPIERAGNLLPQLHALSRQSRHSFSDPESHPGSSSAEMPLHNPSLEAVHSVSSGVGLMLWGLFLKMVLADRIAIFVDNVWQNLFACGTAETVLAALGYSIQIYCDFSGYSCIAVGVSRMFGIELVENFNTPCFARSISDFWHRWHISLSTWLRDYIYIPLGGSRCSREKKYRNILVTFLVSGLWHGAAWTFIIWGLLHGLYQILGDLLKPIRRKFCSALRVSRSAFSFRFGQALVTFLLVTFAWIFFRAGSLTQAFFFLQRMFTRWDPWVLFDEGIFQYGLDRREFEIFSAGLFALLLAGVVRAKNGPDSGRTGNQCIGNGSPANRVKQENNRINSYTDGMDMGRFLMSQNLAFRWAVYLALILIILVYGEYGVDFSSGAFIYSGF